MGRIVPSQVVGAIEKMYGWAKDSADGKAANDPSLGPDQAPNIGMLTSLVRAVPEELLPLNPDDLLVVEAAKGAMEGALTSWAGAPHEGAAAKLRSSAVFGGIHPVVAVLKVLRSCPDERASAATPDLASIPDNKARQSLRLDVSTAFRAHSNGEYKAATVMAGAVVEAILLWRIKGADPTTINAATTAHDATSKTKIGARDPETWVLAEYISVAANAGLIDTQTRTTCDLCREFRNLIHPGRVLAQGADATKSTALAALAAMQRLLE